MRPEGEPGGAPAGLPGETAGPEDPAIDGGVAGASGPGSPRVTANPIQVSAAGRRTPAVLGAAA